MDIGAIITTIGSIILVLLKIWQDGDPARKEAQRAEEIRKGRQDITEGNTAAVAERIDRLLTVQAGAASGGAPGVGAGAPAAGDAGTLQRLAALGVISGQALGEGRKL